MAMAVRADTIRVTREPKDPKWTDLGGPDTPGEDYLLLINGLPAGGTYWCGADYVLDGQRWASWGPAGLSMGHPDRETAEAAQVTAYLTDPDRYDRDITERQRAKEAKLARLAAEAAARAEDRRRYRLGDDAPGTTVWTLPSHHAYFATREDAEAVYEWLLAHDLNDVSSLHQIRVEERDTRRVIVFERSRLGGEETDTWVVTCLHDPPAVDTTARPDLVELLRADHYPVHFPLIDYGHNLACSCCTRKNGSPREVVLWPCPVFTTARDRAPAS